MTGNYCYDIAITKEGETNTISDNQIINSSHVSIRGNKNVVSGNTIINPSWHAIIIFSGSSNNISENTINSGFMGGIYLLNPTGGNIISDNNITSDYTGENGIFLYRSNYNTIIRNYIANQDTGINISRGTGNSVYLCTTETNSTGMFISRGKNNTTTFCRIDSNDVGVHIEDADTSLIKWCKITGNTGYGIELLGSSNTNIFSNNLIGNNGATSVYDTTHIQAYDDSADANFWNAEYPTGGNYWSDYDGTDDSSGADQNIPGSDGIGDTPYPLHPLLVDNEDNYPLMNPWAVSCGDCSCDREWRLPGHGGDRILRDLAGLPLSVCRLFSIRHAGSDRSLGRRARNHKEGDKKGLTVVAGFLRWVGGCRVHHVQCIWPVPGDQNEQGNHTSIDVVARSG